MAWGSLVADPLSRIPRPIVALALVFASLLYTAAEAAATPKVTLSAHFAPNVLGQSTTLFYELSISEPVAVETLDLKLPEGTNLAGSSLGLAECQPQLLEEEGLEACPANSIMGHGTAIGGIELTSTPPRLITTSANVSFALGPTTTETANPTILMLVEALEPYAMIVLTSQLVPASPPYSYQLDVHAPLRTAWLEGPDIALLRMKASIGPHGITYQRTEHSRIVSFHPRGFTEPERCPGPPHHHRGFPFEARLHFYDGATAVAHTRAPCPHQHHPK